MNLQIEVYKTKVSYILFPRHNQTFRALPCHETERKWPHSLPCGRATLPTKLVKKNSLKRQSLLTECEVCHRDCFLTHTPNLTQQWGLRDARISAGLVIETDWMIWFELVKMYLLVRDWWTQEGWPLKLDYRIPSQRYLLSGRLLNGTLGGFWKCPRKE